MKKFLNPLIFSLKILLLVIFLFFGWIYLNVANFLKGKKTRDDSTAKGLFGPENANADVWSPGWTPSCPFVATYDGKKFVAQNDFLCGSPEYFIREYLLLNNNNLFRTLRPDLLKLDQTPQKLNGKIVLQIQENEPEESFVDWLKLIRVVHSKDSEIVVDSSFEKFFVFQKSLQETIVMPSLVLINKENKTEFLKNRDYLWNDPGQPENFLLKKNDVIEFSFTGLQSNKPPLLLVKSTFRDWMMGEVKEYAESIPLSSILHSPLAIKAGLVLVSIFCFILGKKSLGLASLPLVFGAQGKSIIFSYKDPQGILHQVAINKPRAWNFHIETIEFPKEAVWPDGSMHITAEFTKKHKLAFVGVTQNIEQVEYSQEELKLTSAQSTRLGDITNDLSSDASNRLHMIPGDQVNLTFEDPKLNLAENQKETYLVYTSGFYGALRKKYKKIAGNWPEKIPLEFQEYYKTLNEIRVN